MGTFSLPTELRGACRMLGRPAVSAATSLARTALVAKDARATALLLLTAPSAFRRGRAKHVRELAIVVVDGEGWWCW